MLVELAAAIPDGIVCFFVSYSYMDAVVSKWNDMGILQARTSLPVLHPLHISSAVRRQGCFTRAPERSMIDMHSPLITQHRGSSMKVTIDANLHDVC